MSCFSKEFNLTQHKYTKDLFKDSGITNFTKVVTLLHMNLKLLINEGDFFDDFTLYRKLIGKLNFLTHTRPDLSYTIRTLSLFMQCPRIPHWKALQHTLNYIHSNSYHSILFFFLTNKKLISMFS